MKVAIFINEDRTSIYLRRMTFAGHKIEQVWNDLTSCTIIRDLKVVGDGAIENEIAYGVPLFSSSFSTISDSADAGTYSLIIAYRGDERVAQILTKNRVEVFYSQRLSDYLDEDRRKNE